MQIYDCKPSKDDPSRFEWALRAPEAQLFDIAGKKIGKHYAGPTWESYDGSKVVGEVKARTDSPDANAIPWLLLIAKSASGDGVFGQTATIQRADTSAASAPTEGCSPTLAGNEVSRALHGQLLLLLRQSAERYSRPARCTAGPM